MSQTAGYTLRSAVLAIVVLFAWAGFAGADDLDPPIFRGTPLGVETHWTPTGGWNTQVYGQEGGGVTVNPLPPSLIQEMAEPTDNAPYGEGSTIYGITIPNWIDELPLKIGRIQLTWLGPAGDEPVLMGITGQDGSGPVTGVVTDHPAIVPHVFTQPDGGATWWDFTIQPNPDQEQFQFNLPAGSAVVQVDVDTASIPEPAMFGLVVVAGMMLVRRNRRLCIG